MSMSRLLNEAVSRGLLRSLDAQFAMMVATDDEPVVMLAAAMLSHDTGEGHVCLPLSYLDDVHCFAGKAPELTAEMLVLAGDPAHWERALSASFAVSSGDEATPLKLQDGRLYLNRMWRNEQRIAAFFGQHNHPVERDDVTVRRVLDTLFGMRETIDWQKVAAAVALTRRISVISGGPGTGKTTTVARLLVAMIQLENTGTLRIQLTAPTGKAAARLTESLGRSLQTLPGSDALLSSLAGEACTLHRLLGARAGSQTFRYHAGNRLHLDVLVVDEASMVDLPMMARLIMALPDHACVIFLGDRDQLASVEAGAVLGDLCHYMTVGYSVPRASQLNRLTGYDLPAEAHIVPDSLPDALCLLRQSYRFSDESGIGQLAQAVNQCDLVAVHRVLASGLDDIHARQLAASDDYRVMIDEVAGHYHHYLEGVNAGADPSEVLRAFSQFQLLCALREGPFGLSGLNERIEQALLRKGKIRQGVRSANRWYAGRPVMIARNDRTLGLFNGDIGVALPAESGLRVWFFMPDGSLKSVQPSRLPLHDTAYAMTVHKSQGSEFEHAALVLPDQFVPVLTRELVYTAITRAKKKISLYTRMAVFDRAIRTRTERRSGLMDSFRAQIYTSSE